MVLFHAISTFHRNGKLSLTKVAEEFAVDRLYVEAPGRASDDIMFAIIDDGFARRLSKI